MKGRGSALFVVTAVVLSLCSPLFAHHGSAAYDMSKTITMKCTVTKFVWSNPHVQLYFDATDDKGEIVHWTAETQNPSMLARTGWTRDTLKAGDQVTVVANPNKVGAPVVFLQKVVLANGQELEAKKAF